MNDTDVAARLAEALHRQGCDDPCAGHCVTDAAALLPVVRELGDLRAAEELARMASLLAKAHDVGPARRCRNRAATLRGEAGR